MEECSQEAAGGCATMEDTSTKAKRIKKKPVLMADFTTIQDDEEAMDLDEEDGEDTGQPQPTKAKNITKTTLKGKSTLGVKTKKTDTTKSTTKAAKLQTTLDKLAVQKALCKEMLTVKVSLNVKC